MKPFKGTSSMVSDKAEAKMLQYEQAVQGGSRENTFVHEDAAQETSADQIKLLTPLLL